MVMEHVTNFTPEALENLFSRWNDSIYRARAVSRNLFREGVNDFDEMVNVAQKTRRLLKTHFEIPQLKLVKQSFSQDGTQKFLFELPDGLRIESVMIPNVGQSENNQALCISSQVGCAMGCTFCLTGTMGLKRNLETWEIVEQYRAVKRIIGKNISNIVFMGMGEPLHNLENVIQAISIFTSPFGSNLPPRKITVSTSGMLPELQELARRTQVSLALTLSAPENDLRTKIMPINRKWNIDQVMQTVKNIAQQKKDRIFLEYVLLKGINDQPSHAIKIAELLKGISCKLNLIPFNSFPNSAFETPSDPDVYQFGRLLRDRGIAVSIRITRGRDISAACGQLAH